MSDQRDLAFDIEIDPDSERFDNESGYQETDVEAPPYLLPTDEIAPNILVILDEEQRCACG